ncbi:ketoacyl-synt-domain-containing protein [Mollisia scopiformis]|uniref:Ketoacyl-synt-domain-containing protein n=1 Tax=Mollisia scopiformis TaxID=149040 RepID=A0A194X2C5_MOLSC|nr:ketoacyl-synt-domain-containing protein [Mollisia scopiformis]KUJ14328.1 ketoacyl-synt-domain-containing protein [Mollisia scopiformis]
MTEAHASYSRNGSDGKSTDRDVAIIGMSGRFPSADNVSELWQILSGACDLHQTIPKDRFDMNELLEPEQLARFGCFINQPGFFDARLFNMSPREALQTDPIHRILLMVTYEALEMSGYSGARGQRVGTFFGQATDDWRESNVSQDIDVHYIPATQRAFGPGRLNYHFKWDGPSYSIDTACSSSATAIEMAYKAILNGEVDIAVAGGGNIITGHQMYAGLSKGGFLSNTGPCKTFDSEADGYCRGEAVGVVVLKRFEAAVTDNDNIEAIIKSVETNHSAHAISITHPHSGAQQDLYGRTLQKTRIDPNQVGYVEMHGTGTQAGDSVEGHSVVDFFSKNRTPSDPPLYVGSVKSNIGHGEAAAGISSVIKSLLMFQHNQIPAHCGIKTTLSDIFAAAVGRNIRVASQTEPFLTQRRILVNNFNATGGNTCILLEGPCPRPASVVEDPRSHHVIAISGHTPASFEGNRSRIIQYLEENPEVSLADLSYSTTARKLHNNIRIAYSISTKEDLLACLKKSTQVPKPIEKKPVAFLFPGQGSHYLGMGKGLFETCPPFRQSLRTLNDICQEQSQVSFLDFITAEKGDLRSFQPVQIHLAIVSLQLALADLWKSWGFIPQAVVGHSLGEFAALCVAGVLSARDCLYLVAMRAKLLQERCEPGAYGMLAVQADRKMMERVLEGNDFTTCAIACLNGPSSSIVSGKMLEIEDLRATFKGQSIPTKLLDISFAFHSVQMDPILDEFKTCAENVEFRAPKIAVTSYTGCLVTAEGVFGAKYMRQQTRNIVNFTSALQSCLTLGQASDTIWLECGAGSSLLSMAKATIGSLPTHSITSIAPNVSEWKTVTEGLTKAYNSGIDIQWQEYHQPFDIGLRLLDTPTYSFDCQNYWVQNSGKKVGKSDSRNFGGKGGLSRSQGPASTRGLPSITHLTTEKTAPEHSLRELSNVSRVPSSPHSLSTLGRTDTTTYTLNTAEATLLAAIQGHLVEGVGLCPSSVYLDVAFVAASKVLSKVYLGRNVGVEISDMNIFSPLVVITGTLEPDIKTSVPNALDTDRVVVHFSSLSGTETREHATCTVVNLNSKECQRELRMTAHLVQARMKSLTDPSHRPNRVHYLQKKMIYRIFSTIVTYSEPYQNITDIYLDTDLTEAVATIEFPTSTINERFLYSPYQTDAIIHLAGFVLNGNLGVAEDIVYISSGWKSLRILKDLEANVKYQAYVRMYPEGAGGLFLGDVYLLHKEEVIMTCTGMQFQRMARSTLRTILGLDSTRSLPIVRHTATGLPLGTTTSEEVAVNPRLADAEDFRQIIADETGHPIEALSDEVLIRDLGIDSLLSNSIVSRIGREAGLKLSTSAFASCSKIGDLRRHLLEQAQSSSNKETVKSLSSGSSNPTWSDTPISTPENELNQLRVREQLRSNSVFIQGDHTSGLPILFLIADGAGSAASYTKLSFKLNIPVYGLESPFLGSPLEYTISFEDMVCLFIDELRRLQPHGPYLLGGWSMGGMFAYEIARQLLNAGEDVLGLIMIDSPCPRPIDKFADISMGMLEKTGIFDDANHTGKDGEAKMSLSTKQHLLASVRALGAFEPVAMHPERRPQNIFLIWAKQGLFERLSEKVLAAIAKAKTSGQDTAQLDDMHDWFAAPRIDFGANGWDRLLGDEADYYALEGDHFSIMNPPQIHETAKLVEHCLRSFLKLPLECYKGEQPRRRQE